MNLQACESRIRISKEQALKGKKVWAQIPVKAMSLPPHNFSEINQDLSANCKSGTAFFDAPIPGADPGLLSKKAPATQSAPLKADVLRAHDRLKDSMSQIAAN
ncbi:unnamed protein product, partial [Symbiodinium necroappetens]